MNSLKAGHSVVHAVVEKYPVEGEGVVRVWLSKDQFGVVWVIAVQPAELLLERVIGAPEGHITL